MNDRLLGVAQYGVAERRAIALSPNRVIAAFQPVSFDQRGYPSRVYQDEELFRFIDVMHEGRFERYYGELLGGLTKGEFESLKRIAELIVRFSESLFAKKRTARSSVLSSLHVFRHIRHLFGDARPRVFEIGPGCGYLGAFLLLEGYPYAATDVAQAFYLYQNRFWNFISGSQVNELALGKRSYDSSLSLSPGWVVHVPWWAWAESRPSSLPEVDVVVCNHALNEMHPHALRFTLAMCQAMLQGSTGRKVFLFEGWGASVQGTQASTTEAFYRSGFVLAHKDRLFTAFVPNGSRDSDSCADLPRLIRRNPIARLVRNPIRKLAGLGPQTDHPTYELWEHASPLNPFSRAILEGRQAGGSVERVGLEEINAFYAALLGSDDLLSADEHFLEIAAD